MNEVEGRRPAIRSKWKLLADDLKRGIKRIRIYFGRNRRARVLAGIAGVPVVFILILLSVVIFDTPGKRALKSISNPVASEVYTADSVLIGRYFIQDRIQIN